MVLQIYSLALKRLASALLVIFLALLPQKGWAGTCSLNGREVPFDCFQYNGCGNETGRMICKEYDGKLYGEWDVYQGKHIGYERRFDYKGGHIEQTVDEQSKLHGTQRIFTPTGTLVSEKDFVHGELNGKEHDYYEDGHVRSAIWWDAGKQVFLADYHKNGELLNLTCGNKHYMEEDVSPCGFDGNPSLVILYHPWNETVTLSYLNGIRLAETLSGVSGNVISKQEYDKKDSVLKKFFPDGKVGLKATYKDGRLDGLETEYASSGQIIRKTLWEKGELRNEELYYLNGQQKSFAEIQVQSNRQIIVRKKFYDNGQLQSEGGYAFDTAQEPLFGGYALRWHYAKPLGD